MTRKRTPGGMKSKSRGDWALTGGVCRFTNFLALEDAGVVGCDRIHGPVSVGVEVSRPECRVIDVSTVEYRV